MPLDFQSYDFIKDNFAVGGINLKSALENLADNESPYCKNFFFSASGSITKRAGYEKLNRVQITGAPTITGIYQLLKSNGSSCFITTAGGTIYNTVSNFGLATTIATGQSATALYDFASFQDYAIIVNGVNTNLKYNCIGSTTRLGIVAPVAAPAVAIGAAGVLTGNYRYVYTYVNGDGRESNPSPISTLITPAAQKVDVTVVASTDPQVTNIRIYRTFVGGAIFYTVDTIANVAGVYNDNIPDGSLGAQLSDIDREPPPILIYVETHKNRVFGIDASNLNRLRFSELYDESAWPDLNFIDINPGDGDVITGLISFFDQLIIFKRKNIYILSGTDNTNFVIQQALSESRVGALSNRTIVRMDNHVGFLSERGPYAFDGLRTQYIGGKIEAIFNKTSSLPQQTFNWARANITCAATYKRDQKNWYIIAIPTGASSTNNLLLVYDFVLNNWTIFEGIFANALFIAEESGQPNLYSGDYNGFVYRQDSTNSDGFVHTVSFSTSNTNTATTLQDLSQAIISSTATAGGANTLTDSTLNLTVNIHSGKQIFIWSGTGAGQARTIANNTATVFTVTVPWGVAPDNTSKYVVGGWIIDAAKGVRVKILKGKGAGQVRTITTNTAIEFTVSQAWLDIPDTTSQYSIGFIDAEWDSRWFNYNVPKRVKRLRYLHLNVDRQGNYPLFVGLRFDFLSGDNNTYFIEFPLDVVAGDSIWDVSLWDQATFDQLAQFVRRLSNRDNRIHRSVQVLFRNEAGNQPVTVNSFDLWYQIKGVRR